MTDDQTAPARSNDPRSELPLRDRFYRDIQALLKEANARDDSLVLLDIDVEGVDFVLRMFGPGARDDLLHQLGHRIKTAVGEADWAYHITQGRFAVILPGTDYQDAAVKARCLLDALYDPFDVNGVSYRAECNIGISHYPSHGDTIDELVRAAVSACHQARSSRNGYAAYDSVRDERERHRFSLMVDLERALAGQHSIHLAYQPLTSFATGDCIGMEALCRWRHEDHGPILPGAFLPFVEHTSLILPLTEAILGQGLSDLVQYTKGGYNLRLSVNLSPGLFRHPDLLERICEQLRFFNADPCSVDFEVTETGIMEQPDRALSLLKAIREQGCRVSIDDFGTGHSSLAHLAELPIDTIKIDQRFIQNLDRPWGEAIVGAAVTIADRLGLATVAEGIETESQYNQCRELGITWGQGFYIGHPLFKDELSEWLQATNSN